MSSANPSCVVSSSLASTEVYASGTCCKEANEYRVQEVEIYFLAKKHSSEIHCLLLGRNKASACVQAFLGRGSEAKTP